jgi:hypothetical protein
VTLHCWSCDHEGLQRFTHGAVTRAETGIDVLLLTSCVCTGSHTLRCLLHHSPVTCSTTPPFSPLNGAASGAVRSAMGGRTPGLSRGNQSALYSGDLAALQILSICTVYDSFPRLFSNPNNPELELHMAPCSDCTPWLSSPSGILSCSTHQQCPDTNWVVSTECEDGLVHRIDVNVMLY